MKVLKSIELKHKTYNIIKKIIHHTVEAQICQNKQLKTIRFMKMFNYHIMQVRTYPKFKLKNKN